MRHPAVVTEGSIREGECGPDNAAGGWQSARLPSLRRDGETLASTKVRVAKGSRSRSSCSSRASLVARSFATMGRAPAWSCRCSPQTVRSGRYRSKLARCGGTTRSTLSLSRCWGLGCCCRLARSLRSAERSPGVWVPQPSLAGVRRAMRSVRRAFGTVVRVERSAWPRPSTYPSYRSGVRTAYNFGMTFPESLRTPDTYPSVTAGRVEAADVDGVKRLEDP